MTKLEAFCQQYRQAVEDLLGVSSVEFFGSAANANFVPGRSDLDVFVHGHKIPRDSKRRAIALVKELNAKH